MSSQWQSVTSELEGFTGVFFCLSCFSFSVWRTRWHIPRASDASRPPSCSELDLAGGTRVLGLSSWGPTVGWASPCADESSFPNPLFGTDYPLMANVPVKVPGGLQWCVRSKYS